MIRFKQCPSFDSPHKYQFYALGRDEEAKVFPFKNMLLHNKQKYLFQSYLNFHFPLVDSGNLAQIYPRHVTHDINPGKRRSKPDNLFAQMIS